MRIVKNAGEFYIDMEPTDTEYIGLNSHGSLWIHMTPENLEILKTEIEVALKPEEEIPTQEEIDKAAEAEKRHQENLNQAASLRR